MMYKTSFQEMPAWTMVSRAMKETGVTCKLKSRTNMATSRTHWSAVGVRGHTRRSWCTFDSSQGASPSL